MIETDTEYPEDKVINWMDGATKRIIHMLILLMISGTVVICLLIFIPTLREPPYSFITLLAMFGPFGMLNAAIYIFRIKFRR